MMSITMVCTLPKAPVDGITASAVERTGRPAIQCSAILIS
jgi:hypothetical protein